MSLLQKYPPPPPLHDTLTVCTPLDVPHLDTPLDVPHLDTPLDVPHLDTPLDWLLLLGCKQLGTLNREESVSLLQKYLPPPCL